MMSYEFSTVIFLFTYNYKSTLNFFYDKKLFQNRLEKPVQK